MHLLDTSSLIIGGVLRYILEKETNLAKALVWIVGVILAIITQTGCSLFPGTKFYVSLFFYTMEFMVSEVWMAS